MIRLLVIVSLWMGGLSAAHAGCNGSNLFEAMPAKRQQDMHMAADAVPFAHGILWQARLGTRQVTILGTNHVPDARHPGIVKALRPYMQQARALLVEAGPKEQAMLHQAMQDDPTLMFMPDDSLEDMLPADTWHALEELGAERGMPSALLSRMQPAFLAANLSLPPCAVAEMQAGEGGVDKRVINQAEGLNVPIAALEPYDTIFGIFDSISPEDKLAMLEGAITYASVAEDGTTTMAELYAQGAIQLIQEFNHQQSLDMGQDPAEVERQMALGQEVMIDTRNRAWVPVIEAAAEEGPIVVAAGALHLPGENGLLNLLVEKGWTVSPIALSGDALPMARAGLQ